MKYSKGLRANQNDPETRAMLSFRFRAMYRNLGYSRPDVAKLLHVSERTLHNWETGHHEIPYSAYRLLRLLTRQDLPGPIWAGWHITLGVLWSPEGHGFKPHDSKWWSLLCRRSAVFPALYRENRQLRTLLLGPVRQQPAAEAKALALAWPSAADAPTAKRTGGEADRPKFIQLTL